MKKSTLIAGVSAGIVMFLLGWLFYGISGVMDSHMTEAGIAASKSDEEMNIPLIGVGNLILGYVMAMLYSKWARGTHGFGHGAQFGALVGVMFGFGMGLIWMATGNFMTSTGHIIDGVWQIVSFGIAGGVLALVMGKVGDEE